MKAPTKGNDLLQFVYATNWMRTSIPEYSKRIEPLHTLMEQVYKKAGRRTKRAVSKVSLTELWGRHHDVAFADIKQQLPQSTTLFVPKDGHQLCLFTDASEDQWAAVLTQIPEEQSKRDINEQEHEPLSFLSRSFTGSAAKCSVPEKEGFAVVEAMCKLEFLVAGRNVSIYTDQANLLYLYDPLGQNPGLARHTACKLIRWALKFSGFRYVIEHVAGETNVWADMLTRLAVDRKVKAHMSRFKSLRLSHISSSTNKQFDWP